MVLQKKVVSDKIALIVVRTEWCENACEFKKRKIINKLKKKQKEKFSLLPNDDKF